MAFGTQQGSKGQQTQEDILFLGNGDRKQREILNHEEPWLWAVKQSWRFRGCDGDKITFTRATLDTFLKNRVGPERRVWLRVAERQFDSVVERVVRAPEESIGKHLAAAVPITLQSFAHNGYSPTMKILRIAWMDPLMRAGHWGPGENGPAVRVGDSVVILKPPAQGFEGLLEEVTTMRLAKE